MENQEEKLETTQEETTNDVEITNIEEVEEEDNFVEVLSEETKGYNVPGFKSSVVDLDTIDQYLKANQLKYLDSIIQAEEENKLVVENSNDFMALPLDVQKAAVEHAEKAMYDPAYFEKNNLSKDLIKPIQILATIRAKREEAKIKSWKIEYYARIISRLKEFKRVKKQDSLNKMKNSSKFRVVMFKIRLKHFIKRLCRK